jgi:outer membrane protein TolC
MFFKSLFDIRTVISITLLALLNANYALGKESLSLEQAVSLAQKNDPWLVGNQHTQTALESLSLAASTLPDPRVSIGVANIAADSFEFDQEAMTQFKVGVSQMFPRGDSLAIRQKQLKLISGQYPFQRQERKAKVAVTVGKLWLDAFKAQESIALIEKNRSLFEQLADVAQASYSSAVGRTRQQDIIRAQLELTQLEDRLTQLHQQRETSIQQLSEWLFSANYQQARTMEELLSLSSISLSQQLSDTPLLNPQLYTVGATISPQQLLPYISNHPLLKAIEKKIQASGSGIELAKQKYKPEWGVNASYGYRDDASLGVERSDLFSVGLSFDVPLFTGNRQDKELQAAVSKTEAIKTEKWLLLRKMIASFETAKVQLKRLNQRQVLYQSQLLPQTHQQAEASLTAYTSDDGDFSEVVRARIAELNAEIDALGIRVDRQKTIIQLNYFFTTSTNEVAWQEQ